MSQQQPPGRGRRDYDPARAVDPANDDTRVFGAIHGAPESVQLFEAPRVMLGEVRGVLMFVVAGVLHWLLAAQHGAPAGRIGSWAVVSLALAGGLAAWSVFVQKVEGLRRFLLTLELLAVVAMAVLDTWPSLKLALPH